MILAEELKDNEKEAVLVIEVKGQGQGHIDLKIVCNILPS